MWAASELHFAPLVLSTVTTPFSELPLTPISPTIVLMLIPLIWHVTIPWAALLGSLRIVWRLVGSASRSYQRSPVVRVFRENRTHTVAMRHAASNGSEQIDLPLAQVRSCRVVEGLRRTAALSDLPALGPTRTVLSMKTQTLCT